MALPGNTDIKVTASDALEFEPVIAESRKGGFGFKLAVALVLLGGGAGAWNFFGDGLLQGFGGGDDGIPVIRAQTGPVKVRPENPGGLKIPDRDKLVYDRMQKSTGDGAGDKGRGPERLLPPPEQPLPRPAARKTAEKALVEKTDEKAPTLKPGPKPAPTPKTKPVAKVPTVKDVKAAKRPAPPPPPAAPPSSSRQAFKAAPAPTAEKTEALRPAAPKPKSVAAPKPRPVAQAPAPAPVEAAALASPSPAPISRDKAYLVQLAAARSSQGARTEWERLKAKHGDLLGALGLTVTKADLGPGKGIFYRLRAGPLVSENAARALCRQLAQRQVGCLIIKPMQ